MIRRIVAFTLFSLLTASPLYTRGEMVYFWIENEDIATMNLLDDDSASFNAFIDSGDKIDRAALSVAKTSDRGGWGGKWSGSSERNMTTADFDHQADQKVNGANRIVYGIDTANYSVNNNDSVSWSFLLEISFEDGVSYHAEVLESQIWEGRTGWLKTHVCDPIVMTLGGLPVPEPDSGLLFLVGAGVLGLKRKRRCIQLK